MPELSFYEVEALLRKTTAEVNKPASTKSWLQPNDARSLLTAIEHDADQFYIVSQGRMFRIKYRDDKVWLMPSDGTFVPCGWFTPRQLRKELGEMNVIATV